MQWLHMHGYAIYIWSAYGISLVILMTHLNIIRMYVKKVRKILQLWIK